MNPNEATGLLGLMRRYLFGAVCTITSLVLVAAIWVLWQDVHSLEALNRERTQEGQAMLSTLVSGPLVRQELARAQEIVQRIETNLVTESRMEENYGYFYRIQAQAKAEVPFLRQSSSELTNDGAEYKVIPFNVQATGTYEQVATFLQALETGPKLSLIKSFSFRRREAGADNLTLTVEVKLLGRR